MKRLNRVIPAKAGIDSGFSTKPWRKTPRAFLVINRGPFMGAVAEAAATDFSATTQYEAIH